MYKRIFTSLTVPFVLALAVATGTASARQHQQIGARAAPSSSTQTEVAGQSQREIIRDKLGEIGAWAVPSSSTQTEVAGQSQREIIRDKLGEIGAWAVPSSTQTEVVPRPTAPTTSVVASSSDGFDWNDAGIGAAFVFGIMLVGAASAMTIRRHHGPVAHN
jgi:hypothetical protein